MDKQTEYYLKAALKRLDEAAVKTIKTAAYSEESENIKILQELVKEQLANENSNSATRETR